MRTDQHIRLAGMGATLLAYGGYLLLNGSGPLVIGPYNISTFATVMFALVTLALPETLDRLPFGPSRGDA